jgi:hypothetical protein
MNVWEQLASTLLTIGMALGQMKMAERNPLAPWEAIGSSASVRVVNDTRDSVTVVVSAPDVDDASRRLGTVAPCDSAVLRLPYADTRVRVNIGGEVTTIPVSRPDTTRVVATPIAAC